MGHQNLWQQVRANLLVHLRARADLFLYLWGLDRFIHISAALDNFDIQAPVGSWFSYPDMAFVATDLYERPVVVLGPTFSTCGTVLPLRTQNFAIPVVLIQNNDHFQKGELKSFQLPPVDPE